ncbi:MalY/PatB family protein [Streptococcus caprae]|uniref:cysteine-S-conjugate beta-lyase n=1 Tax=Streptococcus caprae TaxID=1640501 RepID=A0ABV8CSL0_9STRE
MTRYDFTTLPDRLSTNAIKWLKTKEDKDLLPLWIADMDFPVFPEMSEALQGFANRTVFGYDEPSESLFQAIVDWEMAEHHYAISPEDLVLIEGVVPAISVAIQAYTKEGDAVLINTPVYPPFARSVKLNKRKLITNSLLVQNDHFEIDFAQLEKDIVDNEVKLYILCSPHNPGGRVWTRDELEKIGRLCQKHGVLMVSDEIHQDLTLFGHEHHSFNTVAPEFKDFAIILSSATKTFNIAGTKNSFAIIQNPELRKTFKDQQLVNNQHEVSSLGLLATEVALRKGKPWLEQLKPVLEGNITYLAETFDANLPKLKFLKPEGTYLVWLDFSDFGLEHEEISRLLLEEAKVQLNDGLTFGREGKCHFRFNTAAPADIVQEAVDRIVKTFADR